MMSYASWTNALEDADAFPYFLRTCVNNNAVVNVIAKWYVERTTTYVVVTSPIFVHTTLCTLSVTSPLVWCLIRVRDVHVYQFFLDTCTPYLKT